MAGSNRISCNRCDKLQDTERYTCIVRAPANLILSLKRFTYDYRSGRMDKILDKVEFGPTLSLPLCPQQLVSAVYQDPGEYDVQKRNVYGLFAVVVHSGTKLDGGHYYTFARDPTSKLLDTEDDPDNAPWCRYDDDRVTITDWKSLKDHLWTSIDNSEYLLFYRRLDSAAELPPIPEPSLPLNTVAQVIKTNRDFLRRTSERNASLHLLQELETEARLRLQFSDPFVVPLEHLYSGPTAEPADLPPLALLTHATTPTTEGTHVCALCDRIMSAETYRQHLIPELPDACIWSNRWQPPPPEIKSEPAAAASSHLGQESHTPLDFATPEPYSDLRGSSDDYNDPEFNDFQSPAPTTSEI
jgi:hypothetical protein